MLWNSFEKKVEYMQQEQCNAAYGDITTSVSPVSALWELVDSIYLEVYLEALYLPPPPQKKKNPFQAWWNAKFWCSIPKYDIR